jgi:hypothetical protein
MGDQPLPDVWNPPVRPLLAVMLTAVLLLGACDGRAPTPAPTPTAPPATDTTAIASARAALGAPAVQLAQAIIALSAELDAARHDLPRGPPMLAALTTLDPLIAAVRDGADAAERAASATAEIDGAPGVTAARAAVDALVADATAAAVAAEQERDALVPLAELDGAMDAGVARWDAPGSQSQRREDLAVLTDELGAQAQAAQGLVAVPAQCPGMWERRPGWSLLLAERSQRLGDLATGAGGAEYDELRAAFDRDPYGEDRRAADAQDRSCWLEQSAVALAAAAAPGHVEDLETALNP